MVEEARWHVGALRVNASLSLANAGYETDVYYGYLEEPVPDTTFTASMPVQVLLPLGKKAVIELNDDPQYLYFLETQKERAWNNTFVGRLHIALEKLYFQAGSGLSNVRRRMSPELDVNVREKVDSLDGILLWQASEKVSLAALYGFAKYDYGEIAFGGYDLSGTLNRDESFIDLVTFLQPSTKVRLFIDGQYGTYTFKESTTGDRDTRSYGIFGGLSFVPREDEAGPVEPPQGSVSLGYKRFDVIDAAARDGSGLLAAINVSAGIFERTTLRAFLSRDYAFSVYSDGTFYLSSSYGGGVSRRLSRKATFSYDIAFGRSDYPQDTVLPEGRDYKFANHLFALNINLARHLAITLQTALSRRTLGTGEPARNRNFFGLSLSYGVPLGSISAPVRGMSR